MNTVSVSVSELTGPALDWAVAKCERKVVNEKHKGYQGLIRGMWGAMRYKPSTLWSQGGPIIERECICLDSVGNFTTHTCEWEATCYGESCGSGVPLWIVRGPTPLIAAMRCYVASKLGGTVEIPSELLS
jgi:hypothetical protein